MWNLWNVRESVIREGRV